MVRYGEVNAHLTLDKQLLYLKGFGVATANGIKDLYFAISPAKPGYFAFNGSVTPADNRCVFNYA